MGVASFTIFRYAINGGSVFSGKHSVCRSGGGRPPARESAKQSFAGGRLAGLAGSVVGEGGHLTEVLISILI